MWDSTGSNLEVSASVWRGCSSARCRPRVVLLPCCQPDIASPSVCEVTQHCYETAGPRPQKKPLPFMAKESPEHLTHDPSPARNILETRAQAPDRRAPDTCIFQTPQAEKPERLRPRPRLNPNLNRFTKRPGAPRKCRSLRRPKLRTPSKLESQCQCP